MGIENLSLSRSWSPVPKRCAKSSSGSTQDFRFLCGGYCPMSANTGGPSSHDERRFRQPLALLSYTSSNRIHSASFRQSAYLHRLALLYNLNPYNIMNFHIRCGTPDCDWNFEMVDLSEPCFDACYAEFARHCIGTHRADTDKTLRVFLNLEEWTLTLLTDAPPANAADLTHSGSSLPPV